MTLFIRKKLLTISLVLPCLITSNSLAESKIVYPLQKISALECRFQKFSELSDACKIDLPILHTDDYTKYLKDDGGYNIYTRVYTVLWASSYKYGWDVGNGGHEGTDIATAEGTPVYSIADGKVIVANKIIGRGNVISIEHEINGKTVISNYAHLSKIDIQEGDQVLAGDKIGEVGSTGNSFGNHLHFQIDLKYKFHPYYYDYTDCPYSYNKITESDICTPLLEAHTIDPLLFLETAGGVLNDIKTTEKISIGTTPNTSSNQNDSSFDIFDVAVYRDSPSEMVKKVQKMMRDIGAYKKGLTGDYVDIEDDILAYQISKGIVVSASDTGAGYWGPKTRMQVKKDYFDYSPSSSTVATKLQGSDEVIVRDFSKKVDRIDRTNILTREQIEQREVDDFMKKYDIEIKLDDIGGNIPTGQSKNLSINITDRKGRGFRGSMPGELTFGVDESTVEVFPKSLYYFTDGKRDIKLKGLKGGVTNLAVKVGSKTIKTFVLSVYGEGVQIVPVSGKFALASTSTLGENKTGTFTFKDAKGKEIVNIKFEGKYSLKSDQDIKFCIKKGNIKDIQKIVDKTCRDTDYMKNPEFTYADTVGGVVVFDYIVTDKSGKIQVMSADTSLATKSVTTILPKGLTKEYVYYNEIVKLLSNGIAGGISKGYFNEDKGLKEKDARDWLVNTLRYMKKTNTDSQFKALVNAKLDILKLEKVSEFDTISRATFLQQAAKYLVLKDTKVVSIEYKDLDEQGNKQANAIFDKNTTWKDQFGKNYYRPEKTLTRGEAAYFLATLLKKQEPILVTVK